MKFLPILVILLACAVVLWPHRPRSALSLLSPHDRAKLAAAYAKRRRKRFHAVVNRRASAPVDYDEFLAACDAVVPRTARWLWLALVFALVGTSVSACAADHIMGAQAGPVVCSGPPGAHGVIADTLRLPQLGGGTLVVVRCFWY